MQWTLRLEPPGYVSIKTTGTFTSAGHAHMLEALLSQSYWQPGTHTFFDHRALDFSSASFQTMVSAGDIQSTHDERIGNGKTAILLKQGLAYATLRQFHALTEGSVQADIMLFTEEATALRWLLG